MSNLGEVVGSLMVGLIRARRIADEQSAVVAEYYKSNPLLEGLSVPRIRIPEFTIDMPFLIEGYSVGDIGAIQNPVTIADTANSQLRSTLSKNNIKLNPAFHRVFVGEVKSRLALVKRSPDIISKETVVRNVLDAFADAITKTKTTLTSSDKNAIAGDLRSRISKIGIVKEPVASGIKVGIKTAEVKEQASSANVVRLKITLKEELI